MQQQEQARAQMEACARACAQAGGYRQRIFGEGPVSYISSISHLSASAIMSEAEQQQGQQRLDGVAPEYLEEKRARVLSERRSSTQVAHIEAADAAYNFRANRIKVANTVDPASVLI